MLRSLSVFILLTAFASSIAQGLLRDKYIDEIILPITYLDGTKKDLLNAGYRGFIIDASSKINDSFLSELDQFLKAHPEEFIAFFQQGVDHYLGDDLYSYFIQKSINIDRQYLPLCDSLLNSGKQILFFTDKMEELKLYSEDFLTYAEVGASFPR